MRVATKTPGERGDEEVRRLVRLPPKKKPPRYDRRRNRVHIPDPDSDTDPDLQDKDLSLNYKDARATGLIDPQLPSELESLIGGAMDVDARHITLSREAEIVDAARTIHSGVKDQDWGPGCPYRYSLDHAINKLHGQPRVSAFVYDRMLRTLRGQEQPWPRIARALRVASRQMLRMDPVLAYDLNDALIAVEQLGAQDRRAAHVVETTHSDRLKALGTMVSAGLVNVPGTCQAVNWARVALTIDHTVRTLLTNNSHVKIAGNVDPSRYNALYASLFRGMLTAAHQSLTEAGPASK